MMYHLPTSSNNDQLPAKPAKPPSEDDSQRESGKVDEGETDKQEEDDTAVQQELVGESREVDEGETDKQQQEEATVEQELVCEHDSNNEDKDVSESTTTGMSELCLFVCPVHNIILIHCGQSFFLSQVAKGPITGCSQV